MAHMKTDWSVEDTIENGVKETQFNDNENKSWIEGVIKKGVRHTFNGWVYEKVCLQNFQLTTTANSKLSYTPCYNQYGLLRKNVYLEHEQKLFKNVWQDF